MAGRRWSPDKQQRKCACMHEGRENEPIGRGLSLLQRVEGNSLCGRRRPRQEVPETSQQTQFVSTGSGKNREHSCCQPFHQLLICWYIFLPNGARFRCVTDNIVSTAKKK